MPYLASHVLRAAVVRVCNSLGIDPRSLGRGRFPDRGDENDVADAVAERTWIPMLPASDAPGVPGLLAVSWFDEDDVPCVHAYRVHRVLAECMGRDAADQVLALMVAVTGMSREQLGLNIEPHSRSPDGCVRPSARPSRHKPSVHLTPYSQYANAIAQPVPAGVR